MSLSSLHDTGHDMYLPNKRAPRSSAIQNAPSTQAEREAWMRQRQAQAPNIRQRSKRIEHALRAVQEQFGVTRAQLLGRSRAHTIAQARGQACRDLRKLDMSFCEIARALNFKQHSSVLYHCQKGASPERRSQHESDTVDCQPVSGNDADPRLRPAIPLTKPGGTSHPALMNFDGEVFWWLD